MCWFELLDWSRASELLLLAIIRDWTRLRDKNIAIIITKTDSDCNIQDILGLLPPDSPAAEQTMEGLPINEDDYIVELDLAPTVEPTFTSEHDSAFNDALSDP